MGIKLRLPICEIWCEIFQLFSLACLFYFTFGPKSFVHQWTAK